MSASDNLSTKYSGLVTEFVRNFGREDATSYQRGYNVSPLGRVEADERMKHSALRHLRAAPNPGQRGTTGLISVHVCWLQKSQPKQECQNTPLISAATLINLISAATLIKLRLN
jgi:hypothetical protein